MEKIFKDYLFQHHILVSEKEGTIDEAFNTITALANVYSIRIVKGAKYACESMLRDAADNLGDRVPEPFYRMFPNSVRVMTPDQLLYDQLYHYTQTYGMGWFDAPAGHSIFEEETPSEMADESNREKFFDKMVAEKSEAKNFVIMIEDDAVAKLVEYLRELIESPRPLNEGQMRFLYEGFIKYDTAITANTNIPCKRIAVELFYLTKSIIFAKKLKLSDTIKLVEYIQNNLYGSTDLKKLNFKNKDRKLITAFIDYHLSAEHFEGYKEVRKAFNQRKIWCGLLHHIHYKPKGRIAQKFVKDIREGKNQSLNSGFERCMRHDRPVEAAEYLKNNEGSGALMRNMNYILSRCKNDKEIEEVISCLE